MVGVAQLVEHQIVDLAVAGSSPVAHPIKISITKLWKNPPCHTIKIL